MSSSGNGQSWATAWKTLGNITGLSAGDVVYISGSATCSTYSGTTWTITNGTRANPIIYRAGQDSGHNSPIIISYSGGTGFVGSGSGGALTGIYIDGNYEGSRNITLRGAFGASGSTAWDGVRLSYMNMDSTGLGGTTFIYWEFDHNYVTLPKNSDHFMASSASAGDLGYTINSIHDNEMILYANPTNGFGDDGFQWIENVSFYNNNIRSYWETGTYTNHQDFIQTAGSYVSIYNNYFEGGGNYPVYGDLFGSASHWRVYNNVMRMSGSGNLPLQFMGIGFESVSGATLDDIIIANNTCYGNGSASCVNLGGGYSGNKVTNGYVVNNLAYASGIDLTPGTGGSITSSNNYSGTTNIHFTNTGLYPTGNWSLLVTSTNAIDGGISPAYLTGIYTTDYAGNTRSGTWDIGAYEYGTGLILPISSHVGIGAGVVFK